MHLSTGVGIADTRMSKTSEEHCPHESTAWLRRKTLVGIITQINVQL